MSEYPSMKSMVWSAAHALADFIADPSFLTREGTKARLDICDICPKRANTRCTKCGCVLPVKAPIRTFHCPIAKWPGDKNIVNYTLETAIYGNDKALILKTIDSIRWTTKPHIFTDVSIRLPNVRAYCEPYPWMVRNVKAEYYLILREGVILSPQAFTLIQEKLKRLEFKEGIEGAAIFAEDLKVIPRSGPLYEYPVQGVI